MGQVDGRFHVDEVHGGIGIWFEVDDPRWGFQRPVQGVQITHIDPFYLNAPLVGQILIHPHIRTGIQTSMAYHAVTVFEQPEEDLAHRRHAARGGHRPCPAFQMLDQVLYGTARRPACFIEPAPV